MSAKNVVTSRLRKLTSHNNENINFLRAFLENPLRVGAISPSSPELAKAMIEDIFPNEKSVVLEIGVGTGAITKFLEARLKNKNSYIGIEVNEKFVELLRRRFPELIIIHGDACCATEIVKKAGVEKVRYIISSLPFTSLPNKTCKRILSEIDKFMVEGCLFRTFQYAHCYYLSPAVEFRRYMNLRYGKAKKSRLVLKNVPPAYTLTWQTF